MKKQGLIEKLEDLATFLTLAANDSGKEKTKETDKGIGGDSRLICFWEGKEEAYKIAFIKVDGIIKEAKIR